MLGSFALNIIFSRCLAEYYDVSFGIICGNINDFDNTWAKELYLASNDQYTRQIHNRQIILNSFLTSKTLANFDLGSTSDTEKKLLEVGFNYCITKYNDKLRNELIKNLPFQNEINPKGSIVIHFRCGEVLHMDGRYIHSSKYKDIINLFKTTMPEKDIIIICGPIPPVEIDDFSVFEGCKKIVQDVDSLSELAIWRIFLECDILVTAKSGFSYSVALLRDINKTTYYAEMWHTKLDNWITWYKNE